MEKNIPNFLGILGSPPIQANEHEDCFMASHYRDKKNRVVIQYYDVETGKVKKLSRKKYNFLDGQSDNEVARWVEQWAAQNIRSQKMDKKVLYSGDEALALFESFLDERVKLRNLEPETKRDDLGRFHNHIAPFFVSEKQQKDVRQWGLTIPEFTAYLMTNSALSRTQIGKNLALLRRFSEFLFRRGIIDKPWIVLQPTEGKAATTPLEFEITSYHVLRYVMLECKDDRVKLMALLGFFGSLRPAETFALKRSDFYTGKASLDVSKTYSRFKTYRLGSKLTVFIDRQLKSAANKNKRPPKTERSKDYVTIWSRKAAREIAKILKTREEFLFSKPGEPDQHYSRDYLFKLWAETGQKDLGVTLHDLRRASGVYLGRVKEVSIQLLQEHIRHTKSETTELYMRRPKQKKVVVTEQDFGDVS